MKQATDILIIRHGQTAWNKKKRLQGHSDIPLNEEGRLQAVTLAETLQNEPLDAIFPVICSVHGKRQMRLHATINCLSRSTSHSANVAMAFAKA